MKLFRKSNIKWLVTAVVLLTAIFLFIYRLLPYSDDEIRNSIVETEHRYNYVIKKGNTPLLYFENITDDSLFVRLISDDVRVVERSLGCWVNSSFIIPSCKGRIVTVFNRCDSMFLEKEYIKDIIKEQINHNENTLASLSHARLEMDYYLDTHGYKDKGYTDVVRYRDSLDVEKERLQSVISLLSELAECKDMQVEYNEEFKVYFQNKTEICKQINTCNARGNTLLQVSDSITPRDVTAINLWNIFPFSMKQFKETVFIEGKTFHNDITDREIEKIPQDISGDTLTTVPRLNIIKGSPVFTRNGIFLGLIGGDTIINRRIIRKSL